MQAKGSDRSRGLAGRGSGLGRQHLQGDLGIWGCCLVRSQTRAGTHMRSLQCIVSRGEVRNAVLERRLEVVLEIRHVQAHEQHRMCSWEARWLWKFGLHAQSSLSPLQHGALETAAVSRSEVEDRSSAGRTGPGASIAQNVMRLASTIVCRRGRSKTEAQQAKTALKGLIS